MAETKGWIIDRRLFEAARETDGAMIVDGETADGEPMLIIVLVGQKNIADFKREASVVFPAMNWK